MTRSISEQRVGPSGSRDAAAGAVVRAFSGVWPRVHPSAWIAPGAVVVGDVELGPDTSIWYGAVLRGDVHSIRVGARTNVQDHAVVHVTRDRFSCHIGDEVTLGHRSVVHGCRVEDGALIGIGAVVLDGAAVGEGALVAAGALVTPGTRVAPRTLVVGIPARELRELDDSELEVQRSRALDYVKTARAHAAEDAR